MTEVTTNGGAQMLPSEDGLVPYVVQVKMSAHLLNPAFEIAVEGADVWFDVATVRVVPRTKKRTVIEKGLAEAGIEKTADLEARLLDEHAAYVWRAKPTEPAALRLT
jgi:hypothetical protein